MLAQVKGISERMAMEIYRQFEDKRDMRNAMMFLQRYNITGNLAAKIYQNMGTECMILSGKILTVLQRIFQV